MKSLFRPAAIALAAVLMVAACTSGTSPTPAPTAVPTAAPTAAPTAPPTEAPTPTPTPDACAPANLALVTPGKLTIGTDNPAYPPYFEPRDGGNTPPWDSGDFVGDPTDGQGFESAVAYAVAEKLGFTADQVSWVVVKFDNSYAPGPKTFDFDINQVSYLPERAQTADLTDGYYVVNQAVVALKDSPIAAAKTITDLKAYKFGAQVGTTSYNTIVNTIAPAKEPAVYDSNDAAITALQNKQIDGLVVDLPTAFFVTAVQVENGVIVGQFAPPAGADAEHFSLVLGKDSPLTPCVNAAIAALKADGTLDAITKEWLSDKASAPVFQP